MPYKELEKRTEWKRNWAKRNKDKIKAYAKNHYEKIRLGRKPKVRKTQEEIKQTKKNAIKRRMKKAEEYIQKIKKKCEFCPENDIACLVFHHVNKHEKEYEISRMKALSLKTIQKEIDKCIVLCSNCHMKLHYRENGNSEGYTSS